MSTKFNIVEAEYLDSNGGLGYGYVYVCEVCDNPLKEEEQDDFICEYCKEHDADII